MKWMGPNKSCEAAQKYISMAIGELSSLGQAGWFLKYSHLLRSSNKRVICKTGFAVAAWAVAPRASPVVAVGEEEVGSGGLVARVWRTTAAPYIFFALRLYRPIRSDG